MLEGSDENRTENTNIIFRNTAEGEEEKRALPYHISTVLSVLQLCRYDIPECFNHEIIVICYYQIKNFKAMACTTSLNAILCTSDEVLFVWYLQDHT